MQIFTWRMLFIGFKFLLPISICVFLYNKFFVANFISFSQLAKLLTNIPIIYYVALLLFVVLNWSIECLKWKTILKKTYPITFKQSIKSVLAGAAIAQLLPYKTGEYLGRLIYIPAKLRIQASSLSIVSSISQLLCTLIIGLIACLFLPLFPQQNTYLIIVIAVILVATFIYLFSPKLYSIVKINSLQNIFASLKYIDKKLLLYIWSLSAVRYIMFFIPYLILVDYFKIQQDIFISATMIATIFLIQTLVPNFIFTDWAIRTAVPMFVFSMNNKIHISPELAVLPGLIIYIVNIILPMIIGTIFILIKPFKNKA